MSLHGMLSNTGCHRRLCKSLYDQKLTQITYKNSTWIIAYRSNNTLPSELSHVRLSKCIMNSLYVEVHRLDKPGLSKFLSATNRVMIKQTYLCTNNGKVVIVDLVGDTQVPSLCSNQLYAYSRNSRYIVLIFPRQDV